MRDDNASYTNYSKNEADGSKMEVLNFQRRHHIVRGNQFLLKSEGSAFPRPTIMIKNSATKGITPAHSFP